MCQRFTNEHTFILPHPRSTKLHSRTTTIVPRTKTLHRRSTKSHPDTLDSLAGQKWFSTIDQGKAYQQRFMYPDGRHLTAFVTPWGLYEWIRIQTGLNRKNDLILIMTPEKQDKTLELSKHWSVDSTPARNEVIMKRTYPVKSVKCDKICSNY